MLNKLRNDIGAVILIAILGLVLMGATYVNLGPTTDFTGDVGVPSGSGYYIDDVLLTYSDVDAQQADAALTSISGLTYVEDSLIKFTANDTYAVRTLSEVRTDLGLVIGTNVQAYDAGLTSLAGLTYASDSFIKVTATDVYAIRTVTETKTDLSLNYVENLKVKLDGTAPPVAATDDVTLGYTVGSRFFDVTNNKEYVCLDNTDGAAVWTETTLAGSGYTNLTSFVDQTAWRVFYSNADGDVVELALGADGTYFGSNGATAAPTFSVPAGGGDVLKVGTPVDSQIGVWTGDGTIEGAASLTYDGANLQLTGDIGSTGTKITKGWFTDMTVANAIAGDITGNAATVTGFTPASGSLTLSGADALTLTTAAATNVTLPTTGTLLANTIEDTTPELGGELDAGAHTIGFTQQSTTGDGTTTINWTLGNKFKFTFGAQNDTFTFTAPTNPCNILLMLIQDGTGSRLATWPGTVKWAGGTAPTLTTTAAGIDICSFYWNGTNYFGVASLAFATP